MGITFSVVANIWILICINQNIFISIRETVRINLLIQPYMH